MKLLLKIHQNQIFFFFIIFFKKSLNFSLNLKSYFIKVIENKLIQEDLTQLIIR